MDKIYDSYKVVLSDGSSPIYKKNFSAADAVAANFYAKTGKEATIYGFSGEILRVVKTWRKSART